MIHLLVQIVLLICQIVFVTITLFQTVVVLTLHFKFQSLCTLELFSEKQIAGKISNNNGGVGVGTHKKENNP